MLGWWAALFHVSSPGGKSLASLNQHMFTSWWEILSKPNRQASFASESLDTVDRYAFTLQWVRT